MSDYIEKFEPFKSIKEINDIINEVKQLREYYYSKRYEEMQQLIIQLSNKYLIDSFNWNLLHPVMPTTVQQAYSNAESFMRLKGISVLMKYGKNIEEQFSSEEQAFIDSVIK